MIRATKAAILAAVLIAAAACSGDTEPAAPEASASASSEASQVPRGAEPAPLSLAMQTCLAETVGSVQADAVTEGPDVVCVESRLVESLGDDTYLWVGADTDNSIVLRGSGLPDRGADTLSLARWSRGLVERYDAAGVGGIFGVRIKNVADPETVVYTDFNDTIGDLNLCSRLAGDGTETTQISLYLGLGADTVNCVLGSIFTEGGDDTVVGVTTGAAVQAGPGADDVSGDPGADTIMLGPGPDSADVVGQGPDNVNGGLGFDTVAASSGDTVTSAEVVR